MKLNRFLGDLGPRLFKFVAQVTSTIGLYIINNEENFSKLPSSEAYLRKYKPIFLLGKVN